MSEDTLYDIDIIFINGRSSVYQVTGPCPEGSMTCGRHKEVREYFNAMTQGGMNEEDY